MTVQVSPERMRVIESVGFGITGDIGGLKRTIYWTPDGRMMKAISQIREFVKRDTKGNVVDSGTRDANLDKGWLLQKPSVLKLYCPNCDTWHDTAAEIKACGIRLKKFEQRELDKAQLEEKQHTSDLEQKVAQLEAMVKKLMEAQNR